MGSSVSWRHSAQLLLAAGLGIGLVLAWRSNLYANVALALTAGLWLVLAPHLGMPPLRRDEATPRASTAVADLAVARAMLDASPTPLVVVENGEARALGRAARRLFSTDERIAPTLAAQLDGQAQRIRLAGRSYRIDRAEVRGAGATRAVLSFADVEIVERTAEARATREMIQVLNHEVMNALAPITSLADTALATARDDGADDGLVAMLGTLARRAEGLQRFTEAYRELARLPPPVPALAALGDLVADLARLFDGRWGGRVAFTANPAPPEPVAIDVEQIGQALWALLQNGAEAALGAPEPCVALSIARTADRVVFTVADSGPGLANDVRARIFDAFFTTKPDGSGVGLSLARQIARAHGGDLRLGDGARTSFALTLPV